jgi:hypothetical protein
VRLTPSQIAMMQLLGERLPRGGRTLKERIQEGHAFLVSITGQDFGFDPQRWHDYLRETKAGGYRWGGMAKRIARATSDAEWCRAVEELRGDAPGREGASSGQ